MTNLCTTETGRGLESNIRLDAHRLPVPRTPEPLRDVFRQMPGVSEVATVDLPNRSGMVMPEADALAAFPLLARSILVPFDFSAASVRLFRWALSIAEASGAKLSLLHVIHPQGPTVSRQASFQFESNTDRIHAARSLLRRLFKKISPAAGVVSVHLVVGEPVDEIVRLGRTLKVDLIVMVPHGQRGLRHSFASATTERATRRAACPVLAVPEAALQRWEANLDAPLTDFRRILVPTDFSSGSAAALRYALDLAAKRRAEVHVLNFSPAGFLRPVAGLTEASSAQRLATERLARWVRVHSGSSKHAIPQARVGEPSVYMLLREAALLRADLIVFGPRGYFWAERLRLSSSTDAILRNAPCPVLSLRTEALNPGQ